MLDPVVVWGLSPSEASGASGVVLVAETCGASVSAAKAAALSAGGVASSTKASSVVVSSIVVADCVDCLTGTNCPSNRLAKSKPGNALPLSLALPDVSSVLVVGTIGVVVTMEMVMVVP